MKSLYQLLFVLAAGAATLISGCSSSKSQWLQTQEEAPIVRDEVGGGISMPIEQKGELVIVVDNSKSMHDHLTKFHENIPSLVNAIADKLPIKLHVAVTTVYDERTYDDPDFIKKWAANRPYLHRGEFASIKDEQGNTIANKYFISSDEPNWKAQLQSTLKINVLDLDAGGPQYEESLSPIAAIYGFSPPAKGATPQMLAEMATQHQGFFFGKDSYKIMIFVTDADDGSRITPKQLKDKLVQISGGDESKVMSFGAIVQSDSTNCPRDPGNAVNPPGKKNVIETFLEKTNLLPFLPAKQGQTPVRESNTFSLCGTYGSSLAKFGEAIRKQVLKQKFPLPAGVVPVISNDLDRSLRVTYGKTEIPLETQRGMVGYTIIPGRSQYYLVLNPDLKLDVVPGEQIRLHYTQISQKELNNGRTVRFGTQPGLENQ